jgi:hypothetical protein
LLGNLCGDLVVAFAAQPLQQAVDLGKRILEVGVWGTTEQKLG